MWEALCAYSRGGMRGGKGWYVPPQTNQEPDFGFPEGRLHQTEKASIVHLKQIKTLIWDSPKGDYTKRKGLNVR